MSTHQTKPIFKLGQEIDKKNAYMKNLKQKLGEKEFSLSVQKSKLTD